MACKKYERELFYCHNCPEMKPSFWENLFNIHYGRSGHCARGNFKIFDDTDAIPKDCPLKDLYP